MLIFFDSIIDKITMYKLVLYYLFFLLAAAVGLSMFGILPYTPLAIIYSSTILTIACWIINKLIARMFQVPVNEESAYITAWILALIISPPQSGEYLNILPLLLLAAAAAMTSKYILNIGRKHIFNPAALAVALASIILGQSASWWVGTASMTAFVAFGGIIMLRKLRQFHLAFAFLSAILISTIVLTPEHTLSASLLKALLTSPLLFFAGIMLTEPLTMPSTKDGRIAFGILVGALLVPQAHFGNFSFTPELALLAGNIFGYIVSPKGKHLFMLKETVQSGQDTYDFVLESDKKFSFKPGQYMEWTLAQPKPDARGNRRYLTIASSPSENTTLLGVKFYNNPSTFKQQLLKMHPGDTILGGQLAGDFILPDDPKQKLAFIAGGIGITPFRSMAKYLADKNENRSIVLIHSNRSTEEIVYNEVFEEASKKIDLKAVYTLTDPQSAPPGWQGHTGYITKAMLSQEIPDYLEREFYISGSHRMVTDMKKLLSGIGLPKNKIKTDFFPGLG